MKTTAIITTLLLAASGTAIAADFSAWQYTQPMPVTATGLNRMDLPPATLNVAQPRLEDLRVISPTDGETPLIIDWPELQLQRLVEPRQFGMRLGDGVTELDIAIGTIELIRAIHLRPAAARFIKAVRIESSADGTNWKNLATTNSVIFREPGDMESVVIKLNPQSHSNLRVVIDDKISPPIAFSGARLELGASNPDETPLTTAISKREELKGRTRLTLDLGGRNVFIATVRLFASDPVFSRRAAVLLPTDDSNDDKSMSIASSTIFRIALGDQASSSLEIPIHRSITSSKLIIDIDNGDSPPLKIDAIETTQHPVRVLFHASDTGNWRLISGNALATAPRYDIAAIKQLNSATASPVIVGAIRENKLFAKPTALPDIDAKGVSIDLARCRYRKPVTTPTTGVISIPLDPEVLSHSQSSLHDLRLVQDGKQIPFITDIASGPQMPFVEPTIALTPDPKRPTTTRWTITMPFDSLPSNQLTCVSPTALFERHLSASATVKDSYGNDSRLHLGSAHWSHKPGDPSNEFSLRMEQDRVPLTFTIETDNGDNPPIELTRFRIHHPTVRLIAKLTDTAPLYLYYGNDRASRPEYDLRLVQAELASAPKENATLGSEEKLIASRDPERASSAGSPWLWLALALVVGVLLWVVAKMLPKAPDATD